MKVFLSWSGTRSKLVAELLSDWLRCVIQAVRPWISSRDIERGALWFGQISEKLSETGIGIVCLTAENKGKPWILFEAGALAKGLTRNHVCTLLIDLLPTDVEDPLAQFNHTLPNKEGMLLLVRTLNEQVEIGRLEDRILLNVFDIYWPQFESAFNGIIQTTPPVSTQPRTEESLLAEILANTRGLASKVREIEARLPSDSLANALNDFVRVPTGQDKANALSRLAADEIPRIRNSLMDIALKGKLDEEEGPRIRRSLMDAVQRNRNQKREP